MRVTITVKNLDKVQAMLNNIDRVNYLEPVAQAGGDIFKNAMRRYPPKPPESKYRRTGTLGKSWTNTVMRGGRGGGYIAQIGTLIEYAPYVQDRERQAWMHKGRWHTVQDVAEKKQAEVYKFVIAAIRRWLGRIT